MERPPMTLHEFQHECRRTRDAPFPERERLPRWCSACVEKPAKWPISSRSILDGKAYPHAEIKNEARRVLWHVSEIATALGLTLEDIAAANIEKLRRRYPDGFAVGGGN